MNTEPFSNMIEAGNYNCYEFYLAATEKYGDYKQAQHMDEMVMRSKFICDTEALACYFQKELGLKKGDVYSIFVPSDIESFTAFYALNKLGVIVNFLHPLLPDEALIETVKESGSKGIMCLGVLGLKQHNVDAVNKTGLPILLCRCSDYASPAKKAAAGAGEALLEKILKYREPTLYKDVIKKYSGKKVEGIKNNGTDVAVYLNGGGTTGKSKTIKLTSKAINENVYALGYIDHIIDPGDEGEIIILPFFHAFGLVVAGHMALCNAARIIPLMQFDAKLVLKLYKENNIVGIGGIPNMFKKLYNTPGFDGPHLKNTRMMFVGGDDLSPAFLEAFNGMLEKNGTSASPATALMEPTTRRRARLTSVMRRDTVWPIMVLSSAPRGRPLWEAGTNTRTPLTLTTMPPLFSSVTLPSRVTFSSLAFSMSSQTLTASRRFLDSIA